ncbi:MAG: hypothetical protein ABI270_07070 [Nitrosospira sp.]
MQPPELKSNLDFYPKSGSWTGWSVWFLGLQGKAQRRGMVIPFQGVATLPAPQKLYNLPRSGLTPEGKSQIAKNISIYYSYNLDK